MLIFCFCWFLLLYGITFFWAKEKDFFSPLKFVAAKYALLNLSFILYICFYPEAFDRRILRVCNVTLNEAFLQYTILQTIAYISLVGGIVLFTKKEKTTTSQDNPRYSYRSLKVMSVAFFTIALIAYCIFLNRIGGLHYLLTHLDKRVELQGGQYILNLLPLMAMSILLLLLCIKISNSIADKILFIIVSLVTLGVFNSFGSRENSLLFIITVIVAGNYVFNRYKFSWKNALVVASMAILFFIYILVIPVLRTETEQGNRAEITRAVSIKKFVYNISYTYIDVFAANYFTTNNAWYMDGYLAPVATLLAKNDKGMVPQVDQGVYFNSIVVYERDFRPPLPRKDLSKTSWPTENFGFAYANFLLPGLIGFFFLQGAVFAFSYRLLRNNMHNPIIMMLYVLVVFTFNFSSLRLAGFIKVIPLIYVAYILFNKFGRSQSLRESIKLSI
jgi:hypothetical protein